MFCLNNFDQDKIISCTYNQHRTDSVVLRANKGRSVPEGEGVAPEHDKEHRAHPYSVNDTLINAHFLSQV